MIRRIVVAGASRGIGRAIAEHLSAKGDRVVALSRQPSPASDWLACDLADPANIAAAAGRIGTPADALVFVAGIWEETAFSAAYDFSTRPVAETQAILDVNLRAPILLAQALVPALRAGRPGRIVLIGSTSGLDHIATPEVAYNASKAGLRGAAQALAHALGPLGIPVCLINPGDIATDEVVAAKAEGLMQPGAPLAVADVVAAVDFALGLSDAAFSTEINLLTRSA